MKNSRWIPMLGTGLTLWSSAAMAAGFSEKFESPDALKAWRTSGDVKLKTVSGDWQTVTAKFNSGNNGQVLIYLATMPSSTGRIQFDNVRFEPEVQVPNADFEADGNWAFTNARFDDKSFSGGKRSVYGEFKLDTDPALDVRQTVPVQGNTEYKMMVDVLVCDNFEGEAKVLVFDPTGMHCLVSNWDDVQLSRLCAIRDKYGRRALEMHSEIGTPALLKRTVDIGGRPGCYRICFAADTSAFEGSLLLRVKDAAGKTIATIPASGARAWHEVRQDLMLPEKAELTLLASGEGTVLVDNLSIDDPKVLPALQKAEWTHEFYPVNGLLTVSVKGGEAWESLNGAMELLNKDLLPLNCRAVSGAEDKANVKVQIGQEYAVPGHEPEGYQLTVDPRSGVTIQAGTTSGAFYGMMTLLQLITTIDGKPAILGCRTTDYPDLTMRGMLYGDPEKCARHKMNHYMYSCGFADPEAENFRADVAKYRQLNMKTIPMFLTFNTHQGVYQANPNAICGIEVKDEKLTLSGVTPAAIAHLYVVRSRLSNLVVRSAEGKVYEEGKDYTVTAGDMPSNFRKESGSKPFTVARTEKSAIADGETVLLSYDYISHVRKERDDYHIAYCPWEPDARAFMDGHLEKLAAKGPDDYINVCNCLFEFWPTARQLETDSRIRKSGMSMPEVYCYEMEHEVAAARKGNPNKKLMIFAGSNTDFTMAVAPKLDKSVVVTIWGYDANWVDAFGKPAMDMWSKLGHETCLMPWTNLRNIRTYAQLAHYAHEKGYPCLGIIGSAWGGRDGGLVETANVSWHVPRSGDENFVNLR